MGKAVLTARQNTRRARCQAPTIILGVSRHAAITECQKHGNENVKTEKWTPHPGDGMLLYISLILWSEMVRQNEEFFIWTPDFAVIYSAATKSGGCVEEGKQNQNQLLLE